MIRSSVGLISSRAGRRQFVALRRLAVRQEPLAVCTSIRLQDGFRCFSGLNEKPKPPPTSSSGLAPIGDGDNLPARLIDFQAASKIEGEESHVAIVELRPGETLRAEAGAMLFMTEGIVMDTNLSGASSAFSRMMTGMSFLIPKCGFGS